MMNSECREAREPVAQIVLNLLSATLNKAENTSGRLSEKLAGIARPFKEIPGSKEEPLPSWPPYFSDIRDIDIRINRVLDSMNEMINNCEM